MVPYFIITLGQILYLLLATIILLVSNILPISECCKMVRLFLKWILDFHFGSEPVHIKVYKLKIAAGENA